MHSSNAGTSDFDFISHSPFAHRLLNRFIIGTLAASEYVDRERRGGERRGEREEERERKREAERERKREAERERSGEREKRRERETGEK